MQAWAQLPPSRPTAATTGMRWCNKVYSRPHQRTGRRPQRLTLRPIGKRMTSRSAPRPQAEGPRRAMIRWGRPRPLGRIRPIRRHTPHHWSTARSSSGVTNKFAPFPLRCMADSESSPAAAAPRRGQPTRQHRVQLLCCGATVPPPDCPVRAPAVRTALALHQAASWPLSPLEHRAEPPQQAKGWDAPLLGRVNSYHRSNHPSLGRAVLTSVPASATVATHSSPAAPWTGLPFVRFGSTINRSGEVECLLFIVDAPDESKRGRSSSLLG